MRAPTFTDRHDAGRRLSQRLRPLAGRSDVIVLALPRGGIPVGIEVARALHAPLDVFVVRKLGVPGHLELAMGAVASGGVRVLNDDVITQLSITPATIDAATTRERRELERRDLAYRDGRALRNVHGATVVLVDDGIATGATMLAAVRAMRQLGAARVVVAAPVVANATRAQLRSEADDVECISSPEDFQSVGAWYRDFHEMSDAEVRALLREPAEPSTQGRDPEVRVVRIKAGDAQLTGDLSVPGDAAGLVLFAHGTGTGRLQPRNRDIAAILQREGFATLLFDLLTPREEANDRLTDAYRFDVPLLAARLVAATDWVATQDDIGGLPAGYFGAETGSAAALVAASQRDTVQCVVSRGGQPDLAGEALSTVTAATLFIVGGLDRQVLVANRGARERMRNARTELAIIPGAGHLCEERGMLEEAARLAGDWFKTYMVAPWLATR